MNSKAIYPGTFDPVTFGHIDLIKRAHAIFPQLIVAVAHNPQKKPLFSVQERLAMIKQVTKGMSGVRVVDFKGLMVHFARTQKIHVIVRGLRMISDFEYEFQMALTNRKLAQDVETIFLMPHESYSYVSSKLLKEAAFLGADLSKFLPKFVEQTLKKRIGRIVSR
ncbi:MAG: pantetheine-phosphate adenylyltransferase [Candidatus Omnitrophica bacterium]|nr:pantetheine-phosphate adenylyltransferase [Candidatus Omnitrophota bacterium]